MQKKLNIALVVDSFYPSVDGVIKVVENYIYYLSKKCNLTLVTSRPQKNSDITKHYKKLPCKVLFCNSYKFNLQNYTVPKPELDADFKNELLKQNFNLIHLHSLFPLGIYMYKFAKANNIPVIATVHSLLLPDIKRYIKADILAFSMLSGFINLYNGMNCVFSLNNKMENYIRENGFTGKSIIMPNATDFKLDKPVSECKKLGLKYLGCSPLDNVLLFIGRLIEGKGILLIADALKILKDKNIKFKMFYVGTGPDENKLKNKIKKLGLENYVTLLGKISDQSVLANLYSASKLFLFPSVYDTDGIVKREAAACLTPSVMLKDTYAASEIINEKNGFLCDSNADDLAECIVNALNNHKLSNIAKNAQKSLYIKWEDTLEQVYNCYEEIINKNN